MLALLWARADAARLERLGHQMLKYETYLVPTLAGMDAILGRYTARIRRDGDTRRLPAAARRDLLGSGSASASSARRGRRATSPTGRGAARATTRFVRDYSRLGGGSWSEPTPSSLAAGSCSTKLHRLRACGLSSAAVLPGRHRGRG